ncbi:MAG TPA: hypothetical protein VJW75_01565, partial [Candidatus Eisenbacteria bacterium]|nr:hypothetical protein [Candidatus Eisenbacteria bacterium]
QASADSAVITLRTVEFSGHRYVVDADFGLAHRVPLMIHGNARMFLSIIHAIGEDLSGGPVAKLEAYGYSRKGKGVMTVPSMRVGGRAYANLRDVPVFDFTEAGDTVVQGMLGIPFLVSSGAVVDFSKDALRLGGRPEDRPAKLLLAAGYRAAKLTISRGNRATLRAYFPSLGRAIPISPSTVSSALTLHHPLFAGRVPMRPAALPDQSPSGTRPDVHLCDRVDFEIEGPCSTPRPRLKTWRSTAPCRSPTSRPSGCSAMTG